MVHKETSDFRICLSLSLLAMVICLPMLIWHYVPKDDTAAFYSPMIREFSAGNFDHAYHPLIPPLFTSIGGIIASIFSIKAFTSAKLTSILFFALSVFPLYFMNKLVFSRKIAVISVFLFIFCSSIMRYAGYGLLDCGKVFFLLLMGYALIHFLEESNWLSLLLIILGAAGMTLIRTEGVILAGCLILVLFFFETLPFNSSSYRFPAKSIIASIAVSVIVLPWVVYEYKMTGYPVVDSRQIPFQEKVQNILGLDVVGKKCEMPRESVEMLDLIGDTYDPDQNTAILWDVSKWIPEDKPSWSQVPSEIFSGLYKPYVIPALIVIFLRIRRKQWNYKETIFLGTIIINTLLFILLLGSWTSKRYITGALPFLLGWASIAVLSIYDYISQKYPGWGRKAIYCFIALWMVISVFEGNKRAVVAHASEKKNERIFNMLKCVDWINEHGKILVPADHPTLKSTVVSYHNGRLPIIVTMSRQLAFLTKADSVTPSIYKKHFTIDEFRRFCQIKHVNFIALDSDLKNICPDLTGYDKYPNIFTPLFKVDSEYGQQILILGFSPNIL